MRKFLMLRAPNQFFPKTIEGIKILFSEFHVMAEDRWAKILHQIYRNEEEWNFYKINGDHSYSDNHPLAENLGINGEELASGLEFLEKQKLIERDEGSNSAVLTEKGFEVARQREMQISQFETNLFLAVFTVLLSIGIIMQTVYQLSELGLIGLISGGILVAITLLLLVLLEKRAEIFKTLWEGR
jgi:hypothetical protein